MLGRSHRIREARIRSHQRGADTMPERKINTIVDRSVERERQANCIRTDALVIGVLLQGSVVEGGGLPTKGRLRSSVQLHQRASVRYVACLIHV